MERAIFLRTGAELREGLEGWDRVYYGAECCPWLLPAPGEALRAAAEAARRGLGFTLVTPWLREASLAPAVSLLEALAQAPETELVFNDFGLARVVMERGLPFTPVMGRLLVRGSAAPASRQGRPHAGGYLSSGSLASPQLASFLAGLGIRRAEADAFGPPGQGAAGGLAVSYHWPLAFVTLAPRCPWRFHGTGWSTGPCPGPCREGGFSLGRAVDGFEVVFRDGGQFHRLEGEPDPAGLPGVDRLVFHPGREGDRP